MSVDYNKHFIECKKPTFWFVQKFYVDTEEYYHFVDKVIL